MNVELYVDVVNVIINLSRHNGSKGLNIMCVLCEDESGVLYVSVYDHVPK